MHTPDFDEERFEIKIKVCKNCQTFDIIPLNGEPVTYQSLLGALEAIKMSYFFEQTGINIEEYRKWQKKQNKNKTPNPY